MKTPGLSIFVAGLLLLVLLGCAERPGGKAASSASFSETFLAPIQAAPGKQFGEGGWLTFELYRDGTFIVDGSGVAWQKSDHYGDVAILRSTRPLPAAYQVSIAVGEIDYGLEKISGLGRDPEYAEGPVNENGCYLLAITDENPAGHHTNDWWHKHRKVVIDVDNNVWGSGMPNPVFMVYFDSANELVSLNPSGEWEYAWKKAVTYERPKWYRAEVERTAEAFILRTYDEKGILLREGSVPLSRVWHTDPGYPDYFVVGDPHENYYQGSMKIKSITLSTKN
ncbi:MAG: hypothetical protein ABH845_03700 [Candidatus Omnitrophota bacterium]